MFYEKAILPRIPVDDLKLALEIRGRSHASKNRTELAESLAEDLEVEEYVIGHERQREIRNIEKVIKEQERIGQVHPYDVACHYTLLNLHTERERRTAAPADPSPMGSSWKGIQTFRREEKEARNDRERNHGEKSGGSILSLEVETKSCRPCKNGVQVLFRTTHHGVQFPGHARDNYAEGKCSDSPGEYNNKRPQAPGVEGKHGSEGDQRRLPPCVVNS